MFDIIRDKFYTLQENLTTSIKGLSVGDKSNKRIAATQNTSLNLNAGTDILDKFQTSWAELNEASQENATKAQEVDDIITKLHKNAEKRMEDIAQMSTVLTSLPDIVNSLNNLSSKIIILESLFDNVERGLIQLQDIIEVREFQSKQLEHKFQIALNNEKKLQMLEDMRKNLAEQLDEKIKKHEIRKRILLKECQEISAEHLSQNLKAFKETNTSAKTENLDADKIIGTALEDIILDNEHSEDLDRFLNNEENSEK